MKNVSRILILFLSGLLLSMIFLFGTINNIIPLKEEIKMQQSKIKTELERRNELIPNFVEIVKGYASHEEEVFTEIANARAKLAGSIQNGSIQDMDKANKSLDLAIKDLALIIEDYPELEASKHFTALQDELSGTQNRISIAKEIYDEKVKKYNDAVQSFPTSIVANMFGYYPMEYLNEYNERVNEEMPEISFD